MSLTLVRRLVLAGALSAALLGAGIAAAEDEPAADATIDAVAVAVLPSEDSYGYDEGFSDLVIPDPLLAAESALQKSVTGALSMCNPGLIAARITVIRGEEGPATGYVLVSELTDTGRSAQEPLTPALLESCAMSLATSAEKAAFGKTTAAIMTEMEALLAVS